MFVDVDDRQGSHALCAERRDTRRLSLVVGLPDRLALRQRARRHDVWAADDLLRHEAARDVEQGKTAGSLAELRSEAAWFIASLAKSTRDRSLP